MTTITPRDRTMTPADRAIAAVAVAAPLLLLVYGVLRWVDGRDGSHGPGWAWDLGHTAFLLAIVGFAILGALLRPRAGQRHSTLGIVAVMAVALGAAAFVWVILGDLFPSIDEAAEVPDLVFNLGPVLFQVGLLTLLVLRVVAGRLPFWSPVLVLLGFVPIAVDLDLLPLGALVILGGLLPLSRPPE
ncbi:MAG: hypothetical protein ACRDP9_13290 [Kribbellaceae bacterium]